MRDRIRVWKQAGVAGLLAAWPAVAFAQPAEAGALPSEKPYAVWAIGVGLLAAIMIVVFMNPRRSPN